MMPTTIAKTNERIASLPNSNSDIRTIATVSDAAGNPVPPPTRPQLSVNLQNHQQGAEQAVRDIQAAIA